LLTRICCSAGELHELIGKLVNPSAERILVLDLRRGMVRKVSKLPDSDAADVADPTLSLGGGQGDRCHLCLSSCHKVEGAKAPGIGSGSGRDVRRAGIDATSTVEIRAAWRARRSTRRRAAGRRGFGQWCSSNAGRHQQIDPASFRRVQHAGPHQVGEGGATWARHGVHFLVGADLDADIDAAVRPDRTHQALARPSGNSEGA
jgi:hypothetical protein